MGGFREYDAYDALGLAALVRERRVSPSELVDEALSRVERLNPMLTTVVQSMGTPARRLAREVDPAAVFAGVPFLLTDLLARYRGFPLHSGSRFFLGYLPDHDSELVRRHPAAGPPLLG